MKTQTQTDKAMDRPLPWKLASGGEIIVDANGVPIVHNVNPSHADLIVRSVNLLPYYEAMAERARIVGNVLALNKHFELNGGKELQKALAALAAVQGKDSK